jgi:hypothetical protein
MHQYLMTMTISWLVCGGLNWLAAFVTTILQIPRMAILLNEHPIKTLAIEVVVYGLVGLPYALVLGPIPWLWAAL